MHLSTLSLVFVALASTTLASPPGSYPGMTPDGLIWKRYEPKSFSQVVPPPPHPAELAPRSIHRSKPSRYHAVVVSARTEEGGGGKRRLMGYKQITANEVKKRALSKKEKGTVSTKKVGKKVNFGIKRSQEEEGEGDEEANEEDEGEGLIEGWSWVEDDEESIEEGKGLSWARKMEVRMKKTKPLFEVAKK